MKCPKCNTISKHFKMLKSGRAQHRCTNPKCRYIFTSLSGTILKGSKLTTEQLVELKSYLEANTSPTLIKMLLGISRDTIYRYKRRWKL